MSLQQREQTLQLTVLAESLEYIVAYIDRTKAKLKQLTAPTQSTESADASPKRKEGASLSPEARAKGGSTSEETSDDAADDVDELRAKPFSHPPSPRERDDASAAQETDAVDRTSVAKLNEQLADLRLRLSKQTEKLRALAAQPGGLISNALRSRLWPFLVEDIAMFIDKFHGDFAAQVYEHKEWYQVKVDVERSFIFLKDLRPSRRDRLRSQLSTLINAIVCIHPDLHYFQGYHDIVSILLLVLGEKKAFVVLEYLSITRFRYFMTTNLDGVVCQLHLLFSLVRLLDAELHGFIVKSGVEPHFALSWVLTWFSHVVDDPSMLARLFDLFLASHALMPLYLTASIIIHYRKDILAGECEYSAVYGFFTKLPQDLPFDAELIPTSIMFSERVPPPRLLRFASTVAFSKRAPYTFRILQGQYPELADKTARQKRGEIARRVSLYAISLSVLAAAAVLANTYLGDQFF